MHRFVKGWISSQEKNRVHGLIGAFRACSHPKRFRVVLAQLHKIKLAQQGTAKQHAIADLVLIQFLAQFGTAERR